VIDWRKYGEVLAVVAVPVALVAGSVALAGGMRGRGARTNPSKSYTTKQSSGDALRDDVLRDGSLVGYVKGPLGRKKSGKTFYTWHRGNLRGESSSRRAAINHVIAADKKRA
jgi:hypothetical protein